MRNSNFGLKNAELKIANNPKIGQMPYKSLQIPGVTGKIGNLSLQTQKIPLCFVWHS